MRADFQLINDWIPPHTRVLDLGCGNGQLLSKLQEHKQAVGLGVEIDPDSITECITRGLSVIEQDLNEGLANFDDDSFDLVVMTQALQTLHNPHLVLDEMLRIGKQAIVSFPNFGNWRCRYYLGVKGRMPVSRFLPSQWYDTLNIHFCTIKDFEELCKSRNINVKHRAFVGHNDQQGFLITYWPNLFSLTAVYHISSD